MFPDAYGDSFQKAAEENYNQIYAWFDTKVDIVIWGHLYATRGFIMVIVGHRSYNCWSSNWSCSVNLHPSNPGPVTETCSICWWVWPRSSQGERNKGGELPELTHSPVPEIWFHVCWFSILKSEPGAIVSHSSYTVCTIWPVLGPPPKWHRRLCKIYVWRN